MVAKRFLFGKAGRKRLLTGARVLADAVKPTLGPGGRTVLLQRPMFNAPLATKDGVTVAEEIELHDGFENMAVQLVFESASKTAITAGDGTTTATVLAHAIYRDGAKLVTAGHHPIDLKRGIERAVEAVTKALEKMSKPVAGVKDIARVATISANGDTQIGDIVGRAVAKVGLEGIIHVEQGQALETTLEVSEGVEVDRGFSSPYFITDKERLIVELEDPYILLCPDKITRVDELVPVLEMVKQKGKPLLVIAEVLGDAMSLLVVNKLQGSMPVCAIMPPYYMEWRKVSMGDLAAQTGGQVAVNGQLAADKPVTLDGIKLADLGRAKRVVVTQEKTTIVGGAGRKADIDARAREIRALYEATNSTVKHQELDDRLRRLVGGAALIKVGGTTDPEVRERKLRVEDALFATKAAVAEGIVPGGGVALLRASEALKKVDKDVTPEQAAGVAIIRRACEVPLREIAANAGGFQGSTLIERVRSGKGGFGYNAATGELEDLMKAGVIDPTMVVRLALQNAASIATLMLTTEACIIEGPREIVDYPEKGSGVDGFNTEPILSRRRR